MRKMKNSNGFTLMEMLIVVAIIAVLVAVMIPVMNNSLEKSRDTATVANLRTAYAEAQVAYLTEDATNADVTITKGTGDAAGTITSIAVANVKAMGRNAGFSSVDTNLPFAVTNLGAMGKDAGTYTVTFTYGANGTIEKVECVKANTNGG